MANKAIVATKVGMTQLWDDDNQVVPVTMLQVEPCRVVQVKTDERDGYTAVQVTFGQRDAEKLTKPEAGHFSKAGVDPGQRLVELRLDDVSEIEVGQEFAADLLEAGEKVDVTAVSKGKGFAGVMKRHNFSGQKPATVPIGFTEHPEQSELAQPPQESLKAPEWLDEWAQKK